MERVSFVKMLFNVKPEISVCVCGVGGGALLNQFPELYFKTHNINLSFAHLCIWDAHGTLGLGTNIHIYIYILFYFYFFLSVSTERSSISHLLSQLDTTLPIASDWQNYCSTISFVYAFEVLYLTLIVYVVA